jgi:hypothetical protein
MLRHVGLTHRDTELETERGTDTVHCNIVNNWWNTVSIMASRNTVVNWPIRSLCNHKANHRARLPFTPRPTEWCHMTPEGPTVTSFQRSPSCPPFFFLPQKKNPWNDSFVRKMGAFFLSHLCKCETIVSGPLQRTLYTQHVDIPGRGNESLGENQPLVNVLHV